MSNCSVVKRMAILVRLPADDRFTFARHWRDIHGVMVSRLPNLRCYIQSHVVEDFIMAGEIPAFRADGFVEQRYDSSAEMQEAYASPEAKALLVDEPNYLGHATNYATLSTALPRIEPQGRKLIVVIWHDGDTELVNHLENDLSLLLGCAAVIRDDVETIIPKVSLGGNPQMVDSFLQLYFESVEDAQSAGHFIAQLQAKWAIRPGARIGVYRVFTIQII